MTKLTAIFLNFANAPKTQQNITLNKYCNKLLALPCINTPKNLYPAVQLQIPNSEVSHSNLGRNTKYPAACRGLPQSTAKC